jgi:polysaccharide biosynthesis transport protein
VLLRHRLMIIAGLMAGVAVAGLVRANLASRYEAEAQVVLDVRSTRVVKFDAVLSGLPSAPEVLHTEMDVIASTAMAERLFSHLSAADIAKLKATASLRSPLGRAIGDVSAMIAKHLGHWLPAGWLAIQDRIAPRSAGTSTGVVDREELIGLVMDGLKVSNDGRSYTIHIGFASANAELAATLANCYAREYLASQLDRKAEANRQASDWLRGRLGELRHDLELSEAALEAYRRAAGVLDNTTVATQQLSEINTELVAARGQRLAAESQLNTARVALQNGGDLSAISGVLSSEVVQRLQQKQDELKRRLVQINREYTGKYPGIANLKTEISELARQIGQQAGRIIASLASQVDTARAREQALEHSLAMLETKFGRGSGAEVKLMQLKREADANRVVYETYLNRYKETSEQEKLQEPDAFLISPARPPGVPSYPRSRPLYILGMIFGGVIGAAGAFLRDALDQRLRSAGDVEKVTGLPVLALLPSLPGRRQLSPEEHVLRQPGSLFNEALRTTWAAISLCDDVLPNRVIAVTSSVPDEGKTAYCLSLARSLAADGHKVLLIDGDMRRPGVGKSLGSSKGLGLAELLAGRIDLPEAIQTDPASGADYIAAENPGYHPQDLFTAQRLGPIISQVRRMYDVVLIDTPPILVAADAALIARRADRCLFFIRWGATSRERVSSALSRLALYNVSVCGIVLSHVDMRKHSSYAAEEGYYRSYGPRQRRLAGACQHFS